LQFITSLEQEMAHLQSDAEVGDQGCLNMTGSMLSRQQAYCTFIASMQQPTHQTDPNLILHLALRYH
jgi:hypothetical protein